MLIGCSNNINIYPQNVISFNSQDVLIIPQQPIPGRAAVEIFQESLLDPPSSRGFFSPALQGGWITLMVEQGSPCAFTTSGTARVGAAILLPVLSAWTGPGPRWRKCWILAGRWSGRPRRSGGSPAGRCRCSARPAPSARWSGSWGQGKPWGKNSSDTHQLFQTSCLHSFQCLFN